MMEMMTTLNNNLLLVEEVDVVDGVRGLLNRLERLVKEFRSVMRSNHQIKILSRSKLISQLAQEPQENVLLMKSSPFVS